MRNWIIVAMLLLANAEVAKAEEAKPTEVKKEGPDAGWIGTVSTVVGTILGAIISPVSIYLYRRRYRPILTPSVEPDGGSILLTPMWDVQDLQDWKKRFEADPNARPISTGNAKYARLKVRNTGRKEKAVHCRGTLVGMEKLVNGKRTALPFPDPEPLIWAGVDSVERELPREIPAFLNICMVNLKTNKADLCVQHYPIMYMSLLDEDGTYFFHILLTADNADPIETVVVRVTWNKTTSEFNVEMDKAVT